MTINQLRRVALSLPEAMEAPHFHMASFRVRVLARYPEWVEKLPWGGKIVGLRIELAKADASVVKALVGAAWEAKAPKGLRRGLLVAMPYRRAR